MSEKDIFSCISNKTYHVWLSDIKCLGRGYSMIYRCISLCYRERESCRFLVLRREMRYATSKNCDTVGVSFYRFHIKKYILQETNIQQNRPLVEQFSIQWFKDIFRTIITKFSHYLSCWSFNFSSFCRKNFGLLNLPFQNACLPCFRTLAPKRDSLG